jgi:hypothetical protein
MKPTRPGQAAMHASHSPRSESTPPGREAARLPRSLARLLAAIARRPEEGEPAFDPLRLAVAGPELLRRLGSGARAGRVERASDQAALLRSAFELALARDPEGRLAGAPPGPAPDPGAWWRRVLGLLEGMAAEQLAPDGTLLACALLPPADWPLPEAIVAAACGLEPGLLSRWCRARACIARGELSRAERQLQALLARGEPASLGGPLRETLACAQEARGALPVAQSGFERAWRAGAGPRAAVAALGLALALGRRASAERLAGELEGQVRGSGLGRAAREVRLRWELSGHQRRLSALALRSDQSEGIARSCDGSVRGLLAALFGGCEAVRAGGPA